MNTVSDIERLRAAEQEAQDIVTRAREEARRVRRETEARVAELSQTSGDDLTAMRERVQSEEQGEADAFVNASRERVDTAAKEIAERLDSHRQEAVKTVVEALARL